MLNLGQLNTIKSYMDNGQFEAMDEYLSQVYSKQKVGQLDPLVMLNGGHNMNDLATVKLTKEGEKILREHFKQYPALIKIDENKIYKTSLWEIMNIFGEHIYNGCAIPFENNLITIAVSA